MRHDPPPPPLPRLRVPHIKVKASPLGTTAFCPICRKGFSVSYRDFRPGFVARQAARKLVWDHAAEHETVLGGAPMSPVGRIAALVCACEAGAIE